MPATSTELRAAIDRFVGAYSRARPYLDNPAAVEDDDDDELDEDDEIFLDEADRATREFRSAERDLIRIMDERHGHPTRINGERVRVFRVGKEVHIRQDAPG